MAFDAASIKQNVSHDPAHTNVGLAVWTERHRMVVSSQQLISR